MAQRSQHRLERVLDSNAMFAAAYGNIGSSIYYALGLVAALALGLTPLVFIIAGFIFYLTASSYAEATAAYPEAGGASSFARKAFNERLSFFAGWAQLANYIITAAISAYFVPHYLGFIWEPLRHGPADIIVGILVLVFLVVLNVRGVKETARLNLFMALADLATQVLLVIIGLALIFSPETLINQINLGVAPSWRDFLLAIPVGMIAYTGIETISNMSEEAHEAGKSVPNAINKTVFAVFAIYLFLPLIALSALPVECTKAGCQTLLGLPGSKGGFAGDPVLGVVKVFNFPGILQSVTEIYVGILAASILLLAANASLFGVSRLVYSMGNYQQLPRKVRLLHPRYRTPYIALIGCGIVASLAILTGKASFLGNMYALFAMLSFSIAHIAVIALRIKKPDLDRPYMPKGNLTVKSKSIPVFAIIGGACTALAGVITAVLNPLVAGIGALWLVSGMVMYTVYRNKVGLPPGETHLRTIPDPVVETEVGYSSILVVLDATEEYRDALLAAKELAHSSACITVMLLTPVPNGHPLDETLDSEDEAARETLKQAKDLVGRRSRGLRVRCYRSEKSERISREAQLRHAQVIIMPMPTWHNGISEDGILGSTRLKLLQHRPCRVMIIGSIHGFSPEIAVSELPFENVPAYPVERDGRGSPLGAENIMVAVFGDELDQDVMQTACRVASGAQHRQTHVIHAVGVVQTAFDEKPDADELLSIECSLRYVEAVGQEYEGVEVIPHIVCSPSVGGGMISWAYEHTPDLIVLGADEFNTLEDGSAQFLGRATQQLLAGVSTRVLITAASGTEYFIQPVKR